MGLLRWFGGMKRSADASADAWILRCPECGREALAREHGVYRAFARSVGKRILGHCSGCGGMRMLACVRDPERAAALRGEGGVVAE